MSGIMTKAEQKEDHTTDGADFIFSRDGGEACRDRRVEGLQEGDGFCLH